MKYVKHNALSVRTLGTSAAIWAVLLVGCSGEGGNEGPEGSDGPGGDGGSGANVPFVSDDVSRGAFESLVLAADETFGGILNDTEVAMVFDSVNSKFIGRLRNEAPSAVCDVKAAVTLDGFQTVNMTVSGNPYMLNGLAQFGGADFEFPVDPGTTFTDWTLTVETSGCTSAPGPVAGGGEGSGEGGNESGGEGGNESGGEGGNESGGEGGNESGGEGASEASPPIPINQPFSGVFQNQNFAFAFDPAVGAFRGTVENPTNNFICGSRTEIHTGVGTQVIELGPIIPENLAPGQIIKVVMSIGGFVLDTYSLHPESSPCP